MEREKKVIVITGASSGIGRSTALRFAEYGDKIVLAARREKALEELAQQCKDRGAEALVVYCDVSKEEDVKNLADRAAAEYGRIDIWINNAAVSVVGPFDKIPTEDYQRTFDVNVMGYVYGAKAVIPYFRRHNRGILINISSQVGITGQPYSLPYSMSKFAIRGLSLSLEQELADDKDIHVCCVLPAVVDTPLFQQLANYMGREVKAPEPVIDAERVADEIFHLADHPKSEVFVGGMGVQSSILQRISPRRFALQTKHRVEKEHFSDIEEKPKKGNLYEPMPSRYSTVSGGWSNGKGNGHGNFLKNMHISRRTLAIAIPAVAGAVTGAAILLTRNIGKS